MSNQIVELEALSRLIRTWILTSTTEAGSGHPTSSFSAVELMVGLIFGGTFRYDLANPTNPSNDRLIFSKGHASPLYYALWAAAGGIDPDELLSLREWNSRLEGHPTMQFPFTESATGSLGQGLSVGVGMALGLQKLEDSLAKVYVLLGDSEMAEGSVWEAMDSAMHHGLTNIVGIIDVNRLGQRGETMAGHNLAMYRQKCQAFGWQVHEVDGHDFESLSEVYHSLQQQTKPVIIIAKTLKGKGVSFLEDQDGWHGKVLSHEELSVALSELGVVDTSLRGRIASPVVKSPSTDISDGQSAIEYPSYVPNTFISCRKAYGETLANLVAEDSRIVVLDAEVSNSTYSYLAREAVPERFFEMFIAEQNMLGVATGLARRGFRPYVSTFAAFLTRAFDQIRMAQYSEVDMVITGSHAGVSIGQDGSSQMAIEDIAMFRSILGSTVLYPSDARSMQSLVREARYQKGITYIRATRMDTPVLYTSTEQFPIGGCKVLRQSEYDQITLIGAGVTLHECLKAYDMLQSEGIYVRVIDCYSVKPLDLDTLTRASQETQGLIVVEDHGQAGGIAEAIRTELSDSHIPIHSLSVTKTPHSGKPEELLAYEGIDAGTIMIHVQMMLHRLSGK